MPITLLLDLDDTLLETNLDVFLPAYYSALADHLCDVVPREEVLSALGFGVKRMMLSRDARQTLQQVFDAEFYPRLPANLDDLRERIAGFYRNVYPGLGRKTRARDGARELVDWAVAAGHRVALATDPLFPLAATTERIRWAGLDPTRFEIISSYETFHFTKTQAAYFAEVLGRLGWPDHPVLMAGNDEARDVRPAKTLGLNTFHVDPSGNGAAEPVGDLVQLRRWIESNEAGMHAPAFVTKEAVLAMLEATPAVLRGLTAGLGPAQWAQEQSPDDWALIELVCHLRDTEREVHALQISALVESAVPFVARPDVAVWAKQRRYLREDGQASLNEFSAARLSALERLESLPGEVWSKPARHAIFGPSSFLEVIGFMAEHDRLHLRQAWRTMRAQDTGAHRK